MLGHIESNIHENDAWRGMPESSRYKAVEAQIAKSNQGKVGPKWENVEDFARRFVGDILGGASGQVWRGTGAQMSRAIGYHAPMSIFVSTGFISTGHSLGKSVVMLIHVIGEVDLTWKWIGCHGERCREKVRGDINRSIWD